MGFASSFSFVVRVVQKGGNLGFFYLDFWCSNGILIGGQEAPLC